MKSSTLHGLRVVSGLALLHSISATPPDFIVDISPDTGIDAQTTLMVQVCAGVLNRNTDAGFNGVYTLLDDYDYQWLDDIEGITDPNKTNVETFLAHCQSKMKGYLLYDYSAQQSLLPSILTLAAVTDLIPVDVSYQEKMSHSFSGPLPAFNAAEEWKDFSPLTAAKYMYEHYIDETTTLAYMNPGYHNSENPADPPLTEQPHLGLADYMVKEKHFTFYLNDACVPTTDEYVFTLELTGNNPWPRPIPVYGYNDAWPVAGDIFEAETNCNTNHNMGQIASDGVNNLSYFNRKPAVTTPKLQNPFNFETYNSSMTYVMFVMGDGDNVHYVEQSRRDWMKKRVDLCAADPSYYGCFPLTWSLSPQLTHLAPDWMEWYYNKAAETGSDYFLLPPCGDLYSYPAEMPPDVLQSYVHNTEVDCQLMSTSGTIEWEWIAHWKAAVNNYYPLYSANNIVKGLFTVNVPFNLPVPTIWEPLQYYQIIENNVVVFKPREWRGTGGGDAPLSHHNFLSVENMAKELEALPEGTVTWIYMTSDGGGGIDMMYDLVNQLDPRVKIVNHESLIDLALQRG